MSLYPISVPSKRLAASITSAATSFRVNNILGWDGVALAAGDFGTVHYVVFRNAAGTLMEIMQIDPSTIASGSITINLRGLDFEGNISEVTANKLSWLANETIVEFGSHPPQLFRQSYVDLFTAQTVAGVKTFSSSPIVPTPTGNTDAANKAYVDGVAVAGASNANTTTKGIVEEATQAEVDARTTTGGTGAKLFAPLDKIRASLYHDYAADAGANDTYAVTITPAPTAYTTGMVVEFKANTANTGACTLNVNSLGVKSLKVNKDLDPQDGYIKAGAIVLAVYDGTNFQIQSVAGKPSVSQSGEEIYAASSSGNDTYAITLSPAPAAYVTGMAIWVKADVGNTGAATLNVNSLGAKTIKKSVSSDLVTGDIVASEVFLVVYDGTNFQLQSPSATPPTVLSLVPEPASGSVGTGTINNAVNTTGTVQSIVVPVRIVVNAITINVTAVGTTGTLGLGIFSADGQTRLISVTTASISGTGLVSTAVSAVTLEPGMYWFVVVPIGTAGITLTSWSSIALVSATGKTTLNGTYSVTASTMPSTLTLSSIAGGGGGNACRLDN